MSTGLGFTGVTIQKIILAKITQPIKQQYYPVPTYKQKTTDEVIGSRESSSCRKVRCHHQYFWYASQIRISGSVWIIENLFNKDTEKNAYSLPCVSPTSDKLGGIRYSIR